MNASNASEKSRLCEVKKAPSKRAPDKQTKAPPGKAPPKNIPGKAKLIAAVRKLALAFPDASERPSHGSPAWFVGKKQFAALSDNHHGDGEFALWLAAPDGVQELLIDSDPDHFYRPAYVGHLGWVAVRLDTAPWRSVASVIENAYRTRATKKQIAALDAQNTSD